MKVLCRYAPAGPHYVRTGWARAFQAAGHDFKFWVPEGKSAFDAFSEYQPDIFLGTTYDLDRATAKCIALRPQMKVALFASAWGERIDGLDLKRYPLVVAQPEEKALLERLKGECGKPDFVFIHVTNKYLEGTMGGWRSIGVEPVGVLNAADTFDYLDGQYRPELACDVAFCGGYWGYKARNLDSYLLPLCHPSSGLSVRIFGNSPWPVANYLGRIDDHEVKDVFASATVCPNVSEPHSTDLGFDVIERPLKVLSSGGFCLSDHVDESYEVFSDEELVRARSPSEMAQLVRHFVDYPEERLPFMEQGKRKVLAEHTYFDRVSQILTQLGLPEEATRVLQAKSDHLSLA